MGLPSKFLRRPVDAPDIREQLGGEADGAQCREREHWDLVLPPSQDLASGGRESRVKSKLSNLRRIVIEAWPVLWYNHTGILLERPEPRRRVKHERTNSL